MGTTIRLENVVKKFGKKEVIHSINLETREGEFSFLLGPSGAGKTTILNLIAGVVPMTSGNIYIGDRLVNNLKPMERNVAIAFESYALYPDKTVYENMEFPLNAPIRKKDLTPEQKKERVNEFAKLLQIQDLLDRYPAELSGGQQQRVGIARALAASPDILLMDEPFGAVDEITRGQLQTEIARIHRECGITIMFVTHDIGEALRLGTRVLVLDAGKIQQYGTPQEILARPATEFVERLVARQRHACDLSDERLCACEHSGAARAKAALLAQGE